MTTMTRMETFAAGLMLGGLAAQVGCAQPECANNDFRDPECRVLLENQLARLETASGHELRFQPPAATEADTWDALGLAREKQGVAVARVATIGDFALSLDGAENPFTLRLENVDPRAAVVVQTRAGDVEIPAGDDLAREAEVIVEPDETAWIRGTQPCPESFRVAFTGDIQTNPFQFERIVEALRDERDEGEAAGEPLMGLVVVGDITEFSFDDEFERVGEIVARAPVPVSTTPGNHDTFRSTSSGYYDTFGPGTYAYSVCGARIALLDTGNAAIARSVEGRLGELFDASEDRWLIAAMHYPPYAGFTGGGWAREDQAQHVLVELAARQADLIVAGHVHALRDFDDIPVGDVRLREIVVGTAGADQGLGVPRYGYLRVTFSDAGVDTCFVEVAPPGSGGPLNEGLSGRLPYCSG